MTRLSIEEKDILIGTILGDAHVRKLKQESRVEITHSTQQKAYLFWKYEKLKRWCGAKPHLVRIHDARYQKEYLQWRFNTVSRTVFDDLRKIFYRGRIKIIPQNISEIITSPLSLAVWFMG